MPDLSDDQYLACLMAHLEEAGVRRAATLITWLQPELLRERSYQNSPDDPRHLVPWVERVVESAGSATAVIEDRKALYDGVAPGMCVECR